MSNWEDNEPNELPEERDAAVEYERGWRACEAALRERQTNSDLYAAGRIDGRRELLAELPEMLRAYLPRQAELKHLMSLAAYADEDHDWAVGVLRALAEQYNGFETAMITSTVQIMIEQAESPSKPTPQDRKAA